MDKTHVKALSIIINKLGLEHRSTLNILSAYLADHPNVGRKQTLGPLQGRSRILGL